MTKDKPMTVVLIEDDKEDCYKFEKRVELHKKIEIVGITASSYEGLKFVKAKEPEAVILDLLLPSGCGSGIKFLEQLNKTDLRFRPVIVVTSCNNSSILLSKVTDLGIDWFFFKGQRDYSEKLVFDTLLTFRRHMKHEPRQLSDNEQELDEAPSDKEKRIALYIENELNRIGIRNRYKGRIYLTDALYLQITSSFDCKSVIAQIADKYNLSYNTVSSGMQSAINDAWTNTNLDTLKANYIERINAKTGSPTPIEFIRYYNKVIRKML